MNEPREDLPIPPTPGATYLAPGFLGAAAALDAGREVARVELDGRSDTPAVHAFLDTLDEQAGALRDDEVCLFLLGYEASAAIDPLAPRKPRDPSLGPDAWLRVCRRAEVPAAERAAQEDALVLSAPPGARARHVARVATCREHLLAGTLYQANLAHRVEVAPRTRDESARWFASRTREVEPRFAAWVDDAWGTLVSLSPECFLAWDLRAGRAAAYPIKGTRPRGRDAAEDARLLAELRASEKDAAEHVMIVDLLRNDLARASRAGGVTVTELMRPVSVPNVHHLETEVVGELLPGTTLGGLLRATAPGGSITGAPKSAALDVICELEEGARGPYTGCLGAVDAQGRGAASILIRTWVRPERGPGALHVGGGIVVDSSPDDEWYETLHKAAAFGDVRERA